MGVWWRVQTVLRSSNTGRASMAKCGAASLFCIRWCAILQFYVRFSDTVLGPYPDLKFPTLVSRMTRTGIQPSLLFFRTSSTSRSGPRFLKESSMLPPLMYAACVKTLFQLAQEVRQDDGASSALELHFADEEGDPYAVELAARLGGYVVGKDSDFAVLNADGYAGYVPLDEMVWTALTAATVPTDEDEDDGFQKVVNSKGKKKAVASQMAGVGRGILPPDNPLDIQLTATAYAPMDLASHLQISLSLLPLLGALVGNDFSGNRDSSSVSTAQQINLQWLFFERQLTLSQRIVRVASTLRSILTAALTPGGKNKQKQQVHSVMELIERAVAALMIRPIDTMGIGERDKIVERVVDATLQYAIPRYDGDVLGVDGLWSSGICALHSADSCPLLRYISQPLDTDASVPDIEALQEQRESVRALYIAAYRAGRIDPHMLDVMHTGTFWYRQFLENPDLETVARSIARPIQLWSYALLDAALGLPERPEEDVSGDEGSEADEDKTEKDEDEDDDELIDVVEESDDEDMLAPLRGALQQLNGSHAGISKDEPADSAASISSHTASTRPPRSKVVIEYVRRGTRLASEEVTVPSLAQLGLEADDAVPVQLRSAKERMNFLLTALDSDYALIKSLPAEQLIPSLALRWISSRLFERAQESNGSREREKERWTKQEARAFLASFSWSSPVVPETQTEQDRTPIVDRNVQLVAQVLVTLDAIERLCQVLLLNEQLPSPTLRFSGELFHSYLTGTKTISPQGIPDRLWNASTENIEHTFIESVGKRRKDRKKEAEGGSTPTDSWKGTSKGQKMNGVALGSKFSLLANLDA